MKRRGRRQRAAQASGPFTIRVVEGDVEVEGGAEKRGRGRPPATYVHNQIALLVRIIERLRPTWLEKQVHWALPPEARRSKSHRLDILQKHHPDNLSSAVIVDVHSKVYQWLSPFLRDHSGDGRHSLEQRIDELMQQEDQLDPRQLDKLVKHDPSTED